MGLHKSMMIAALCFSVPIVPPAITSIEQPAGGGDLKRNLSSTLPRPDHPTDRLTKDMADEEEPPWNEKGVER